MEFFSSITYPLLRFILGVFVVGCAAILLGGTSKALYWSWRRILRFKFALKPGISLLVIAGIVLVANMYAPAIMIRLYQSWAFRTGAITGAIMALFMLFGPGASGGFWSDAVNYLNSRVPENIVFFCDRMAQGAIAETRGKVDQAAQKYFKAIFEIADESVATRSITSALMTSQAQVRTQAVLALGSLTDVRAVKPLLWMLNDPDPSVQSAVIDTLGDARRQTRCRAVDSQAQDPDLSERAARALGHMGPSAVTHLVEALEWSATGTAPRSTGEAAAKALIAVGSPEAIGPLIRTVESAPRLREASLEALDSIDPAWTKSEAALAAVPTLIADFKGNDTYRRIGAREALFRINPKIAKLEIRCRSCDSEGVNFRCVRCNREYCERCIRSTGQELARKLIEKAYGGSGIFTFGTAKIFDSQGRAFCPDCYGDSPTCVRIEANRISER